MSTTTPSDPYSTFTLPHLPNHKIHISLFHSVTNATDLRAQLLAGNPSFEYAFLDASGILSERHVLAATFRAINDSLHNRMKSRNVHSEIVFCLSPTNNIADSFRRFGLQDGTTAVVAVKVLALEGADGGLDPAEHLAEVVKGMKVPFGDEGLRGLSDLDKIKKIYKLNEAVPGPSAKGGKGGKGQKSQINGVTTNGTSDAGTDSTTTVEDIEGAMLGMMALRGS